MWSGQGPASSLNCPVTLVLESRSIENESPIALWWEVGVMGWHLPHASLLQSIGLQKARHNK